MTAQKTSLFNAFETQLSASVGAADLTFNVDATAPLTSPCYLVIDPTSASKREYVLFDGTFTSTAFVTTSTANRGLGGSAAGAQAHAAGTTVRCVPMHQHFGDLNDRVDLKANDADVVKLAGAQTVTGAKTFSVDPTLADGSSALSLTEGNTAYQARKGNGFFDVTHPDFGAVGDWNGTSGTDDTAAVQLAIDAAEAAGPGSVVFFPPRAGYVLEKLNIKVGDITFVGDQTLLVHKYATIVEGTAGPGSTKAAPIFMVYRDAHDVVIDGFTFDSHPSIATAESSLNDDWYSYLAPIIVHNADRAVVRNCRFEGDERRGVFQHGGNDLRVHDNHFVACGIIAHVGHAQNTNFWDAGPNDQSTWFSPLGLKITDNVFEDYADTGGQVVFLSGANYFTVANNVLRGCNASNAQGIYVYTNDLGLTNEAGTPVLDMHGEVTGNVISGTLADALRFVGYSVSATAQVHTMNLSVADNTVEVTGHGIYLERAHRINVHDNHIDASGSVVRIARDLYRAYIVGNYLASVTGEGTSAFWTSTTLDAQRLSISGNTIISGTGNNRVINVTSGTFLSCAVSDNIIEFTGTEASPTIINIAGATGQLDLSGNRFVIDSAAMADRFVYIIGGSADVVLDRNTTLSSSVVLRMHSITAASVQMVGGDGPGFEATVTAQVKVADWRSVSAFTGAQTLVKVSGSTYFTMTNCWLERSVALNQPVVQAVDCVYSKLSASRVIGNSNAPLVRIDTSGEMAVWNLDLTNNGTGGAGFTTSTSATVTSVSDDRLGFFSATPVTKPAALTAKDASVVDTTYGAEEAAVIENNRTRLDELYTRLQSLGLIT